MRLSEIELRGVLPGRVLRLIIGGIAIMGVLCVADAAVYTVTTTADSGAGSLREAIINANGSPGPDEITFNISGSGPFTIALSSSLPPITDPVRIDGTSQPGWVSSPIIELNGAGAGATPGLQLSSTTQSTIRGLVINRFAEDGILIDGGSAHTIAGNYIGTDITGAIARPNSREGIYVAGSTGNVIGGGTAADRNIISGNGDAGVYLLFGSANVVLGNFLGTAVNGVAALGNGNAGVIIFNSTANVVGGGVAGARNVIAANGNSGVFITGAISSQNQIRGNRIGTTADGGDALPNAGDGVSLVSVGNNLIGGLAEGEANQISGNLKSGISLQGNSAANTIQGNLIGTDAAGKTAMGNAYAGVTLMDATYNTIGGTASTARNVISGNHQDGVFISTNSSGNTVAGNVIGLEIGGIDPVANLYNGITIRSAANNSIGGNGISARNTISANRYHGIQIIGASSSGNVIQANFIGTQSSGASTAGNQGAGICLSGAQNNLIGGADSGLANVISGNTEAGVFLFGAGTTGNVVKGNRIGTDFSGNSAVGNAHEGIYVEGAAANQIGGPALGEGNIISGNGTWGMFVFLATNNIVQGNYLGVGADGNSALGNGNSYAGFHNLEITNFCYQNIIGGQNFGEGNRIAYAPSRSGINYAGIRVREFASNNLLGGNAMFANGGLAIDLQGYEVTPNDPCDIDEGANRIQNFPVLSQAIAGTSLGVRGTLNSTPNHSFRLQFFANPSCDPLYDSGEGMIFLGSKTVVTDGACMADFVAALPPVPTGYVITATATDSANNTSEYSSCLVVSEAPILAFTVSPNGQTLILSWPATPTGIVLKQTEDLSAPVIWVTYPENPVVVDGRNIVTIPISHVGNRFYTLSFE